MKILFWNPNCGSGIEQIGYVYALMLKKLGHEVDLFVTQCINKQQELSKIAPNYDCVILNEPHSKIFDRFKTNNLKNVFAISHSSIENIPLNIVILSLNYLYHIDTYKNFLNVVFPLTYPFAFTKKYDKPIKTIDTCFIGRFNPYKFTKKFIKLLKSNNIMIDQMCLNFVDYPNIDPSEISRNINYKANIINVYSVLNAARQVVIPSTTECLCLIIGEALVNGCQPIVLNMYENKKTFDQFNYPILCDSEKEMMPFIKEKVTLPDEAYEWANEKFSINRCYAELKCLFGKDNNKKLNIYTDKKNYENDVEYQQESKEFLNAKMMIDGIR